MAGPVVRRTFSGGLITTQGAAGEVAHGRPAGNQPSSRTRRGHGPGATVPVAAFTDGRHFYFDDDNAARVGAHLTGRLDLAGRLVRVERSRHRVL